MADITNSSYASAVGGIDLDDDVLELLRIIEPALEVQGVLKILAFRRRRSADLARGDFLALLLDDVDDVLRRQAARLKQVRIHPYAHRVLPGADDRHVADAGEALKLVHHIDDGVVRQEQTIEAAVGRGQADIFENRGRLLLGRDALDLHFQWQRGNGGRDTVLDQDLVLVGIRADREGDDQGVSAVVRARRLHVEHVLDAVDILLERQRDGVDQRPGARARIRRRHLNRRRDYVGILRGRQLDERDQANQDKEQRQHIGEHRPVDEEARNHARPPRGFTSPPDRRRSPCRSLPARPRAAPMRFAADRPWPREKRAECLRSPPSRRGRVRTR